MKAGCFFFSFAFFACIIDGSVPGSIISYVRLYLSCLNPLVAHRLGCAAFVNAGKGVNWGPKKNLAMYVSRYMYMYGYDSIRLQLT